MGKKYLKFLVLSICLCFIATKSFAVVDIPNVMMWMLLNMDVKGEASNNENARKNLAKVNKIFGEKGAVTMEIADAEASVPFDKYAPVVSQDIQPLLDRGGYESIPEIRERVKQNMTLLSAVDVENQTDELTEIEERINLSALYAMQRAKNVLAFSNNAPEEADQQLSSVGNQTDLHHRMVQEQAQDLQAFKRDISLNQLMAQLLEATSMNALVDLQNSTHRTSEAARMVGVR